MSKQDEAWAKGRRAGASGEPQNANPYRGGMVYQAWLMGWVDGVKSRDV
jgi:ribosome modulation factor